LCIGITFCRSGGRESSVRDFGDLPRLLYLSLVRRVGTWLEPLLPPEASASILLFVLVIFIEPLQRVLGRRLEETAHQEMDRVQRLTAEIQQEARQEICEDSCVSLKGA